ncbi:MAG: hypothetical protein ACYCW6_12865 [Candidatus Xenobia bacterium]
MSTIHAAQPRWESLTVNGKPAAMQDDNTVNVSAGDQVDVRFNNLWIHDDKARYSPLYGWDVQDVGDQNPPPPPDRTDTRLRLEGDADMQGGDFTLTVPPAAQHGHQYVLDFVPFQHERPLPPSDGDLSQYLILKVS